MNPVEIIRRKRDGLELSTQEISDFVEGYTSGAVPDYQAASWCMAVFLKGMTARETTDLTLAMARSGDILDLSPELGYVLDKHSSGGVGDKTTLVVLPLVVACGLPVAKMSGRGLAFSGGTLDKLESITGYRVRLSQEEFRTQAREIGIVLAGQTGELAPADGKLYALRDVTATVDSLPLIASSIMSKKIAAGAQGIVLDVKCGVGAFMPDPVSATALAQTMVDIGRLAGRDVVALVSDMNQPLGHAVGNALELREAIDTLQGSGPEDFIEHCMVIAVEMLKLAKRAGRLEVQDERELLAQRLRDGSAWEVFRKMVAAQGGDLAQVDHPERLPAAPVRRLIQASRSGFVSGLNARIIGETALELGAGRHRKEDPIDYGVGLLVPVKVGDAVERGALIFEIHAATDEAAREAEARLATAITWSDAAAPALPLFYGRVGTE